MGVDDIIKKVCDNANWTYDLNILQKEHIVIIDFDDYSLVLNGNVGGSLLFQAKIKELPENISSRNEMLMMSGRMISTLWSHTRTVCTVVDNFITLEQVIEEEFLNVSTVSEVLADFLDDCDFFYDKLNEYFQNYDNLPGMMFGTMI